MQARHVKRRHDARTAHALAAFAGHQFEGWSYEYEDDDSDDRRGGICLACDGTGGDPWNDGITPCEECDGEGYEWWN